MPTTKSLPSPILAALVAQVTAGDDEMTRLERLQHAAEEPGEKARLKRRLNVTWKAREAMVEAIAYAKGETAHDAVIQLALASGLLDAQLASAPIGDDPELCQGIATIKVATDSALLIAERIAGTGARELGMGGFVLPPVRDEKPAGAKAALRMGAHADDVDMAEQLGRRWHALLAEYSATPEENDDKRERLCSDWCTVERMVAATPSTTLAGIAEKARLLRHNVEAGHATDGRDVDLVNSIIADLERMQPAPAYAQAIAAE